ncbi:MAG: superoxide dismutase, partial [Gemmatimonadales bacterium]
MAHTLPPLPYDYTALEPHIDEQTMRIHHDKHHAAYVTNLNNALKDYPALDALSIDALIGKLTDVPEAIRTAVRNNGGGHYNHTLFWEIMAPGGPSEPTGALAGAINSA